MASAAACARGPAAPFSSAAGARAAAVSRPRRRPYASLRGAREFRRVRAGARHGAGGVTVVVAEGGQGSPRVGIVAGPSVGGAVARNRVKRRLRAAIGRVTMRADRDYVVIGSRAVLEAPFQEVVGWVGRAVEE